MKSFLLILPLLILSCGSRSKDSQEINKDNTDNSQPTPSPGTSPQPKDGNKVVCDHYSKAKLYCITLQWVSGPKSDDFSEAKLTITTTDLKAPQKVEAVKVTPWMKIHSHGTGDVQPELKLIDGTNNVFKVTNIYFIMSGPWELLIDATVEGQKDSIEHSVQVP